MTSKAKEVVYSGRRTEENLEHWIVENLSFVFLYLSSVCDANFILNRHGTYSASDLMGFAELV